jgi:hypothetical protein
MIFLRGWVRVFRESLKAIMEGPRMLKSLRELVHRDPFIHFRIVLTSGKEYAIVNPDLLAIGETQITVYAPKSDDWSILRMNQIASIDVTQAA